MLQLDSWMLFPDLLLAFPVTSSLSLLCLTLPTSKMDIKPSLCW